MAEQPSPSDSNTSQIPSVDTRVEGSTTPTLLPTSPVSQAALSNSLLNFTQETFDRITKLMSGELQASAEDFILLEKLNNIATDRYKNINDKATAIKHYLTELKDKVTVLQPQLDQIDELYSNIMQMDTVIKALDAYTSDLEKQFEMAYQT